MGVLKNKLLMVLSSTTNVDKAKRNGLTIGRNVYIGSGTFIDPSHCFLISIGDNVTISSKVHILAHDASTKIHLGYTKIGKVRIGNNVFIGACSIILPGVTIGDNVIVGAGSVVTKDIPPNEVWGGNPARYINDLDRYLEKYKHTKKYGREYRIDMINNRRKEELKEETEKGICLLD